MFPVIDKRTWHDILGTNHTAQQTLSQSKHVKRRTVLGLRVLRGDLFFFHCNLGADIVGINCFYDPDVCLKIMATMKEALEKAGLKRHLMVQPIGYRTPECMDHSNHGIKAGFTGLAEFPFGML